MENDQALMDRADPLLALALLSRLPVNATNTARSARAVWAYPLTGLLLGAPAGLTAWLALAIGLPAALASLTAFALLIALTGAMHEDGLADTADGLWGGWDRTRRLEIMEDSRIGTYGVMALVVGLLARWSALAFLFATDAAFAVLSFLAACILSRAAMPVLMAALPNARQSGLSHSVGEVSASSAALAVGTAFVLSLVLVGASAFCAIVWAGIAVMAIAVVAKSKIGGQTGDILGATQQVSEIAVLLSLAASAA